MRVKMSRERVENWEVGKGSSVTNYSLRVKGDEVIEILLESGDKIWATELLDVMRIIKKAGYKISGKTIDEILGEVVE